MQKTKPGRVTAKGYVSCCSLKSLRGTLFCAFVFVEINPSRAFRDNRSQGFHDLHEHIMDRVLRFVGFRNRATGIGNGVGSHGSKGGVGCGGISKYNSLHRQRP